MTLILVLNLDLRNSLTVESLKKYIYISSLMGRIQVARVKTIAERIMRITIPHPRCTRNEAVSN